MGWESAWASGVVDIWFANRCFRWGRGVESKWPPSLQTAHYSAVWCLFLDFPASAALNFCPPLLRYFLCSWFSYTIFPTFVSSQVAMEINPTYYHQHTIEEFYHNSHPALHKDGQPNFPGYKLATVRYSFEECSFIFSKLTVSKQGFVGLA